MREAERFVLGGSAAFGRVRLMKVLTLRVFAVSVLLVSILLWIHGGARAGFYHDFYKVRHFDPILEIEHFEEVRAFLPGIETLAFGFVAFVGLMTVSRIFEMKRSASD